MQVEGSARRIAAWLFGASLVACVVLAGNTVAVVHCGLENSYCAHGGPPHRWEGRVFTTGVRPATQATVSYAFSSNGTNHPISLTTDARGRYCLRWPRERVTAFVSASKVPSALVVTPDASGRLVAGEGGTRVAATPWSPAVDSAPTCVTKSPAWWRIDGASSDWRFQLMLWLSLAILAGAAIVRFAVPPSVRPRAVAFVVVLAALDVASVAVAWFTRFG
jgi:hypothetical protein